MRNFFVEAATARCGVGSAAADLLELSTGSAPASTHMFDPEVVTAEIRKADKPAIEIIKLLEAPSVPFWVWLIGGLVGFGVLALVLKGKN